MSETQSERRLVDILQSRQANAGMNDVAFSKHLNISQPHWSLVKRNKRGIGRCFAQKIIHCFPELWREVQDAMFPREGAA